MLVSSAASLPVSPPLDGAYWWGNMVVEVAIFAVLIYIALRFLWATRGSVIIRGLGILVLATAVVLSVLSRAFDLERLNYVMQQLAPAAVVGVIVVFQPEIRRGALRRGNSAGGQLNSGNPPTLVCRVQRESTDPSEFDAIEVLA